MSAHNLIQCGCVARNIDAFHKNAITAFDRKIDIQFQITIIARHPWADTYEIQAKLRRAGFQARDVVFQNQRGISITLVNIQRILKHFDINIIAVGRHGHRAKFKLLTFANVKVQEIGVLFLGQFCVHGIHTEIYVTTRLIKICQKLFIKFDPIFDQCIRFDERP